MQTIDSVVSEWSDIISNEIAERKFFDKSEVAAYAKAKLLMAISDCLSIQVSEHEVKRGELSAKYNDPDTPTYQKMKIQKELSSLNIKIKQIQNYQDKGQMSKRYNALKKYVTLNFGQQVIDDFANKLENGIDFDA